MASIQSEINIINTAKTNLAKSLVDAFGVVSLDILNSDGTVKTPGLRDKNNVLKRLSEWAVLVNTAGTKFVLKAGDTMTGLLTLANGLNKGIKFANGTYLTTVGTSDGGPVMLGGYLRFTTGTSWDYSAWAGLGYNSSTKSIYLGIPDGNIFKANNVQSFGRLYTPRVHYLEMGVENAGHVHNYKRVQTYTPGAKHLTSGAYFKIAEVTDYFNFDIIISGGWNTGSPSIARINISLRNGYPTITQLSGFPGGAAPAIRLGQTATNTWNVLVYFDGYSSGSRAPLRYTFEGIGGITVFLPTAADTTTYTKTVDLTLGTVSGVSLTSSNYTSYTVTKTGSGASGSWGIDITGSSASCTGNAAGITGYTFKTLSSKSHSGWINTTTDDKIITTQSFIAYWNGAYNSSGNSNLSYCNLGAFGSATTHAHSDYVTGLSISGNTLAWSKGGTAQTALTIPYATKAGKVEKAIKFKKTDGTAVSYDGFTEVDLTAGVNYATVASKLEGGTIPGWGTLTAANGYNNLASWDYDTRGAYGLAGKGGALSMLLDGFFYQNEGKYRVLDTSDAENYLKYGVDVLNWEASVTYNLWNRIGKVSAINEGDGVSFIITIGSHHNSTVNNTTFICTATYSGLISIREFSGANHSNISIRIGSDNNYPLDVYIDLKSNSSYTGTGQKYRIKVISLMSAAIAAVDTKNVDALSHSSELTSHTTGAITTPGCLLAASRTDSSVGIGTTTPSQKLHVSGGLLRIDNNSKYVIIGCENASYCHYQTDADVAHWFNKRVEVDGAIWRYNTSYGIDSDGYFHAKGVYANRDGSSTLGGVSLYSTEDPMTFGVAFRGTGTYGTHGKVTSDWATYFTMSDNTARGWIFRRGGTNIASISGAGDLTLNRNIYLLRNLGASNGYISYYAPSYYTWITYMNNGGAVSPTSKNSPSYGNVTSWAMRSLIENASGYGWILESCTNANTSTPDVKFAVSANVGNAMIKNSLSANDLRFNKNLAYYNTQTSTVTGIIEISLPNSWTNTMANYEIVVYEYNNTNGGSKILVSGYNYAGNPPTWYNYRVAALGNFTKKVRLARNTSTGKCCILLGETNTAWSYTLVWLNAVYTGYSQQTIWYTGYSISAGITTEANYEKIVTPSRLDAVYATNAGYADSANFAKKLSYTGLDSSAFTVALTPDDFCGRTGWATYLVCNHGNGASYYHLIIAMPFWGAPQYLRLEGGKANSWETFITTENYTTYCAPASHTHSYLPLSGGTVTGTITALHFYESSDIRFKTNLELLTISSKELSNIPLFDFDWINQNTGRNTGTSALAVLAILPNLVSGEDTLHLDYGVLGTIAGVTACKELVQVNLKISNLKSEIEILRERVLELEKKLNDYGLA